MSQDYFAVHRQGRLVSIQNASNWVEASKQASRQEKEETGETYAWTSYNPLYVPPPQWSRYNINPEKENDSGEEKANA